ncbi:carbamoyltransferase C-terminal domain-containing protein [Azospirillum lipoferum]|uniref:Carbamoyltransferase n=1 Tax=Azospirillum lipoferum (strain 4B) TaxID=862719 RepID=G7Z1V2_AZOL4|nr:carbamoyltransferase C-terminal domain-containing protein [Azospirillum lipoferum]CBS87288.1 putative Carbamoyltransferase [Azospirillum lipoferum 4B]
MRGPPVVAGLTAGRTQDGRPHIDGAACLVHGERAWAIAEERLPRRKNAGGAERALSAVLAAAGMELPDIDLFVLSTCGEPVPSPGAPAFLRTDGRWSLQDLGIPPDRIVWCPSHHLSHALHAAHATNARQALVCVFDKEGNTGERNSYYLAGGGSLRLVQSDTAAAARGGIGAAYALATEAIGWCGDTEAGKTMALAAYGRAGADPRLLLADAPSGAIVAGGGPLPHPVTFRQRADLAATVQAQMEAAVVATVERLLARYPVPQLCVAGGVGTNCRLLGALAGAMPELAVRAPYAPGDTGQAIGNALYGLALLGAEAPEMLRQPFLGVEEDRGVVAERAVRRLGQPLACGFDALEMAARRLAGGAIVAVFTGRSEFGPRALGHRSILCHPGDAASLHRLGASIKRRGWFRPFGIVGPAHRVAEACPHARLSRHMEIAGPVGGPWRERLRPVLHIDGTCRFQAVAADDPLGPLLERFEATANVPFLANTSLNRAGEPLAETIEDAIDIVLATGIDLLLTDSGLFAGSPPR